MGIKSSVYSQSRFSESCPSLHGHRKQAGQLFVEMILLLMFFTSVGVFALKSLKSQNILSSLISAPWRSLSTMIETGQWSDNLQEARRLHPSGNRRIVSLKGVNEKEGQ